MMLDDPVQLSQRAELQWSDHETRSLAERADAAVKLKDIIPQSAIIEYVLNATASQMSRWRAERAGDVMATLLAAAQQPATPLPTPPVDHQWRRSRSLMPTLASVHLQAQARLRAIVATAIASIWQGMGTYDEDDVDRFVENAVPIVLAGQTAGSSVDRGVRPASSAPGSHRTRRW